MAISINNKNVKACMIGNTKVKEIYVGSNKVWPEKQDSVITNPFFTGKNIQINDLSVGGMGNLIPMPYGQIGFMIQPIDFKEGDYLLIDDLTTTSKSQTNNFYMFDGDLIRNPKINNASNLSEETDYYAPSEDLCWITILNTFFSMYPDLVSKDENLIKQIKNNMQTVNTGVKKIYLKSKEIGISWRALSSKGAGNWQTAGITTSKCSIKYYRANDTLVEHLNLAITHNGYDFLRASPPMVCGTSVRDTTKVEVIL